MPITRDEVAHLARLSRLALSDAELEHFARSPDAPHLAAWKAFNANISDSGDVGIYHETYRVAPGASESNSGYSRSTTSSSPPIIRQNPRSRPNTPPLVPTST